jgi:arylsulfatase A-like enzyme
VPLLFALACIASACATSPDSGVRGPNVLIVITDDERYGSHHATPQLRDWFDEGAVFTRAYATTPHCCPSRASIFTGQYVHNHRVTHQRQVRLLDHSETIQRQLLSAGYNTGYVGKFLNGWDLGNRPPAFEHSTVGEGYADSPFAIDGAFRLVDYGPSFVFERGRKYIDDWEADDDRPWLLMVAPFAPHEPFQAEEKYAEIPYPWDGTPATEEGSRKDKPPFVRGDASRISEGLGQSKREDQFRTLRTVDDQFMETIDRLEQQGELDNTLVIYLSDNGYLWADHGLIGKGVPYEGSIHIPLYMRGPDVPKRTVDQLVANIDIAPTVYELTGIEPDYKVDGRPLLRSSRETLLLEFDGGEKIPQWSSLISQDWQYTEYEDGFREFYDFEDDPYQLENQPDRAPSELRAILQAARKCAGADCP